jgi:predicted permease
MRWYRKLFNVVRQDRLQHEIDRELSFHINERADEFIASGMNKDEALRAARRQFGNYAEYQERTRDMDTSVWLETLAKDLRYAIRGLRKNPGFTVAAVITLALGIGATTAIFAVINGVLIKPLPYPDPDRLVGVWHSAVFQGGPTNDFNLAPPMYVTYQEQNRTFHDFGVWNNGAASVTGIGDPEQVRTLAVTYGVLPALGVQPVMGRWFSREDDTLGTPETVILSYGYWQRRFGGDQSVIGRTITLDSRPRQIIGVMPEKFRFMRSDPEVILPQRFGGDLNQTSFNYNYFGMARLKPGVTLAQANADVARMLPIWNSSATQALHLTPTLRLLKKDVVGDIGSLLWILMGTVGMVLLIACANVANLLLVRGSGRQREFAIRAALGAGWRRIARELMLESLILALLGGVLGLIFAKAGLRLLINIRPANLPRLTEIDIDPSVMAFVTATSLFAALLFGLIPVVKQLRPQIAIGLRGSGRTASQSRHHHRSQNTLVVMQVALALVLLIGSGLMIRSLQALLNVQPGFTAPEQLQTVRISIPPAQVQQPDRVIQMQKDILDKIAAIPGVASAAFSTSVPTDEPQSRNAVAVENMTSPDLPGPIWVAKSVSPGLLKTQGTPLIVGRDFTWTDIFEQRAVAIVSQSLARETWGDVSRAVGKRIRIGLVGQWQEIVGVAADVHDEGVHLKPSVTVYWRTGVTPGLLGAPPSAPRSVVFAIRTDRAGTESLLNEIRQAVWSVNPNLPLAQVRTLGEVYERSMERTSFTLVMLAIAGSMALALGMVGIYGVMSYAVSQRKREIGIRVALGAQQHSLKRAFVQQGLQLAAVGIVIGGLGAIPLTRVMSSLLFGIRPSDPLTFAAVALLLSIAAASASYLPARRASVVDPVEALRGE